MLWKKIKKIEFKFNDVTLFYGLSFLVLATAIILMIFFIWLRNWGGGPVFDDYSHARDGLSCEFRRSLDGICVESKADVKTAPVAIMIDNHVSARAQSGLADARVVYEAPVEGNYSRFMALYLLDQEIDKIGPVRSARPYFLDWLSEYGKPMYLHVGGSPEALSKIVTFAINDVNEFYRGWYFWRSENREMPHNTYTSSELFCQAWENEGSEFEDTIDYVVWKYGKVDLCEKDCVKEIEVTFANFSFKTQWFFSSSTEKYQRYQALRPHQDMAGKQIWADNIIVQFVKTQIIDAIGRLDMETVGEGEMLLFTKGNAFKGSWKKDSREGRTLWFDENGEELSLTPGITWVQIANQLTKVDY